ncbi:MAG: diacylglycerol kinase family lipid kinase [Caldilinea sp. CFX5]|nr:diacylglycerol kinase family lipid kinase [Caldilinea sp. CFX5]
MAVARSILNHHAPSRTAIHARHTEQLRRVEAAQDQLAQAQAALAAIEAELVRLTQQAMTTGAHSGQMRGVALILNPASKSFLDGAHSPAEIVAALQAVGITPQMELTTPEINARQLARKAVDRGDTLIIAAGGDGTIEEVATALIHSPATLGILPLGTMNNLARALGIPLDLTDAALLLAIGATRHIDVGRVVTADDRIEGYFLETAGIGLSAVATPIGEDAEKGRWSNLLSRLGDFFAFSSTGVTIQCDNEEALLQSQTHLVTISNAPLFGNNMLVAPEAKIDDGLLDVVVYEGMELVDLTRYFFGISNGGRVNDVRIHARRAQRVQVTADIPLPVNADLDVLDAQPRWTVEVVPRALAVVVGNGLALTLPVTAAPVTPPVAGPPPL